MSSSPWSRYTGADGGSGARCGDSAGSLGAELVEERHERGPELVDGAVVHVVHERARRLGQRLRHLARLRERGVRLVHVDQRQLRGEQERLDALAQRRDLIGGHDALIGEPIEDDRRRRSRAAGVSRARRPAAPRRWPDTASRAADRRGRRTTRRTRRWSRIAGRPAAEIDSPPAKLMPTMPTRPSGARSRRCAIQATASSMTSVARGVIMYACRSGSAIVITVTPVPARSCASAVSRGSSMPIEWMPGMSSTARRGLAIRHVELRRHVARGGWAPCARGSTVTRAGVLVGERLRPVHRDWRARTISEAARTYGVATKITTSADDRAAPSRWSEDDARIERASLHCVVRIAASRVTRVVRDRAVRARTASERSERLANAPTSIRMKRLVIAIDGPSGAGKGTIARTLSEALGYRHIDTGAMYRAVGWKALHEGIALDDETAVAAARAAGGDRRRGRRRVDRRPRRDAARFARPRSTRPRPPSRGCRACVRCSSPVSARSAQTAAWSWRAETSAPSCFRMRM